MSGAGKRRWYDQKPRLSRSFQLLETFPPEVQTMIGDCIIQLMIRDFEADKKMKELKSIGPEKVLGIYKSKNKRRKADTDPILHRALNYLFILAPEQQDYIAEQMIEVIQHIYEYFKACQTIQSEPSVSDIARVTNTFVRSGSEDVESFLDTIRIRFEDRLRHTHQIKAQEEKLAALFRRKTRQVVTEGDDESLRVTELDKPDRVRDLDEETY